MNCDYNGGMKKWSEFLQLYNDTSILCASFVAQMINYMLQNYKQTGARLQNYFHLSL